MAGYREPVHWEVEVRSVGGPEESEEAKTRALEVLLQWYLNRREAGMHQRGSGGDYHECCHLP
ncbi:MAG: hypothetical protein AB1576_13070 [Bacillota bacterium]